MITTSDQVTIQKVLRLGTNTSYTTANVSLFLKHDGEQKRFNATSVVNSTGTSTGLLTFANVALWGEGSYSLFVTAESSTDLDGNGVVLDRLASGYLRKIVNETEMTL